MSGSQGPTRTTVVLAEMPCPLCGELAMAAWLPRQPAWVEVRCSQCPKVYRRLKDLRAAGIVPHEIALAASASCKTPQSS